MAWGGGFCDQGDAVWYWTTAGKLKLARGGRECRVIEPPELVDPQPRRLPRANILSWKTGFERGARWLGAVVFAIRVIPCGTGRLMGSLNSHAAAVSVAF